jgi:hypothetical protein
MSAINQQPSLIDRAGELRTDPAALAELLKRAKVLSVGGGKVSADLASAKLLYPNAQSDENYFLGIDRATDTPYFAAHVAESEGLLVIARNRGRTFTARNWFSSSRSGTF